ncbi:MAG: DUF1573 domain-containing protein [Bacteroidota bacterium]|nr:DUF1573 domain-containing protein [Bacteroidota bacterium]
MYFVFTVLIISFSVHSIFAQEKDKRTTASFEYYTHDFGTIKEEGGTVSYDFKFTNAGNVPLKIKNVTPSCGCTVPTWSKDPIAPEGVGVIHVVFDPMNKPGPFSKTLTLDANAYNTPIILTIQGKVVPKARRPHDDFPDKIGNLRMISRYMHMGEIHTEQWQRKTFEIFNQSDTIITIKSFSVSGTYLNVKIEPQEITPGNKAKIIVDYSPKWKNDFGYVQDRIFLLTDDVKEPIKNLFVTANISLAFNLTEQEKIKAPKIKFDKHVHDFGTIKQGEKVTAVFLITNNGINELQILKIKPSCGCTFVEIESKNLKEGASAKLTVLFDSSGKDGVQEKHINIYSNDPDHFNSVITLKAKIQKN